MENDLRRLLDELDAAIDRTREGADDHAELARLVAAVNRRLEGEEEGGLAESLREAGVRFETDHPTLAAAIRRAVDVLGAAGI